jgi:hypothetical protein
VLRRELIDPEIAEHKGRIVKTTGDGLLVEFPSVVEAVTSAPADDVPYCARANARRYSVCRRWRAGVGLWSKKIAVSERLVSAPWKWTPTPTGQRQPGYRLAATSLKVLLRLVPTVPITVAAATPIRDPIRAYSIAVTPP